MFSHAAGLYLNQLDTLAAVERLVLFYVQQHNSVIPHSAFKGQTPDEVYFAKGQSVAEDLAKAHAAAVKARIAANRAIKCEDCRGPPPVPAAAGEAAESSASPSLLHLRHPTS